MEDIIWEWFDKKAWIAYDAATTQILEQAYSQGTTELILDHGFFSNGPYNIDFKQMLQTNQRTKFERRMRRCTGKATRSVATWECKIKKKWTPYDQETSKILENAFSIGVTKVNLDSGAHAQNGPYVVDLVDMKQTNSKSGFSREIRRQVNESTPIRDPEIEDPQNARNSLKRNLVIPPVSPEKLQPCYGTIAVTIKAGRDIASVNALGSDPFVVITTDFSPYLEKTEWKFKTANPVWNQSFAIPVARLDMEGKVFFTIYDYNHLKKNIYLGRLELSLYDLVKFGEISRWMPLTYEARKKNKKQLPGQLDINTKFIPKQVPAPSRIELGEILQAESMQVHQQMVQKVATTQQPHYEDSKKYTGPLASGPMANTDPDFVETRNGRYKLGEILGEGGFATVKQATNCNTSQIVAVKIIKKTIQADTDAIALITREIQILHLVKHETCVSFIDSQETNDNIYIVMEFVGGGDLLDSILSEPGGFSEKVAARAIRDILHGLSYIHSIGICHRDMKPENVLYQPDTQTYKIADFGCARLFTEENPEMDDFEGTIQYMAPEILVADKYTKNVDLWSTGVITYVSLSACFPWEGKTDSEVQESIVSNNIKFYSPEFDKVSQSGIGFIQTLLEPNREKRVTAELALEHPWLKLASNRF